MGQFQNVIRWIARETKRVVVTVVGFSLVAVGLAGIVLPVIPGPLLIIAGLAVLATQYAWARRALDETKKRAVKARDRIRRKKPK